MPSLFAYITQVPPKGLLLKVGRGYTDTLVYGKCWLFPLPCLVKHSLGPDLPYLLTFGSQQLRYGYSFAFAYVEINLQL